jgi:hypothetical protein
MKETNDALWLAFEALARAYPHDDGVRMTADLARWLLEERQRLQPRAPPTMYKVVRTVTQKPHTLVAEPLRRAPVPGQ